MAVLVCQSAVILAKNERIRQSVNSQLHARHWVTRLTVYTKIRAISRANDFNLKKRGRK